jgi:acetyl-CoA C-acetyltransferase
MAGTGKNGPLVLGGSVVPFGRYRDGSNWRDWVRRAAAEALADAGLEAGDIDALVVGSESDFLSLQVNPAPVVAAEIGLTGCSALRAEGGGCSGALALRAGVMHVLSGLAKRVLVIGFEDAASHLPSEDVRLVYALSFDADVDGLAGATSATLYALSMAEHMGIFGTTEAQMAAVAVKNRGNARRNPWAHKPMALTVEDVLASRPVSTPYKLLDCSLLSDGAAALVLARDDDAPKPTRPRARLVGSGCATDAARLGDRAARHRFTAKAQAARAAYDQAGIADPARAIDVAEVYDAFTGAEIQSLEALGLAPEGEVAAAVVAGEFGADGRIPVNLSGGLMGQGGAPGAVGIAQAVTVERLLGGRYWPAAQPKRELRYGLVDTHGGVATVAAVHVLERVEA